MPGHVSSLSTQFTESVIREMSRLIVLHHGDEGINLAQGFPDFAAPAEVKEAACAAIRADINQYAVTWGNAELRAAIAGKALRTYSLEVDPEREVTVCCGATETMMATLLAVLERGDEVVIIEPFYENYGPACLISGAVPRYVRLRPPDWHIDEDELRAAFSSRTAAIIVNTPHNPSGKVFTRAELELIAGLCIEHDALAVTDEIYEHLVYEGTHIPIATLPGMAARTVTVNGLSKTYSLTGWRVGWAIANPQVTNAIRKVHDFLTVGAAAPLQVAAVTALSLPDAYYDNLLAAYAERRTHMLDTLRLAGFTVFEPKGAYYVMTDIGALTDESDVDFTRRLVEKVGVAVVPGSSFYAEAAHGRSQVRFAFPKRMATLEAARERLLTLREAAATV
ncbi:MAG TPA: aminotransferase class I/II-fold pyridoxal phosphate-dependent enzyme [Candidatus Dormibacteraeota bacterium]|jgi:aminotransferase|nr:aminotransferase class I/II-fold pyridoxal phosphate-dependent enzyme [Candidatus Dormibacteraeota bacterium]